MSDESSESRKVINNIRVLACKHIIHKERPILYIAFFLDGEVQCDCGEELHINAELSKSDYRPVGINHIIEYDSSVLKLSPLELGNSYKRRYKGDEWVMKKIVE